jgi:hypothetical protein
MSANARDRSDGAIAVLWVPLITVSVHLVGSAILFGILSGPLAILASPFLSIFGWFFVIPELCGVMLQWSFYRPTESNEPEFWLMMLPSFSAGALFMGFLGPKEIGSELRWTVAYVLAGGVSAAWSLLAIRFVKKRGARTANPHATDTGFAEQERAS